MENNRKIQFIRCGSSASISQKLLALGNSLNTFLKKQYCSMPLAFAISICSVQLLPASDSNSFSDAQKTWRCAINAYMLSEPTG